MRLLLTTDFPVAEKSPDHLHPHGTVRDNSRNPKFTEKLQALYPRPFSLLDIGCAGGGFVADTIEAGNIAIGLEGSDHNKREQRAAWKDYPHNLFTCDCAKIFTIHEEGKTAPYKFDVITAWEVMEHFNEADLKVVVANVRRHLAPRGLFTGSVSTFRDGAWHQTIQCEGWWRCLVEFAGFETRQDIEKYFGADWVRGPKQQAPYSFNFVMERNIEHEDSCDGSHGISRSAPVPSSPFARP